MEEDVTFEIRALIRIYRALTGSLCRSIVLGSVVSLAPSLAGKCSSAKREKFNENLVQALIQFNKTENSLTRRQLAKLDFIDPLHLPSGIFVKWNFLLEIRQVMMLL